MGGTGILLFLSILVTLVTADHYDVRCKCVCPNLGIINTTSPATETRRIYIKNVPPNHCDCANVVIPSLSVDAQSPESIHLPEAFCPRCVCRYEQRNTIIKFVVIMILCVIGFLTTYMAYLFFIDPVIVKWKQNSYRQQREEEDKEVTPESEDISTVSSRDNITVMTSRRVMGRSAALQRIGSHQDKWKRQVQEQRRHIYDQHTMLN